MKFSTSDKSEASWYNLSELFLFITIRHRAKQGPDLSSIVRQFVSLCISCDYSEMRGSVDR